MKRQTKSIKHPNNRPHTVNANTAAFLYRIYLLLFKASDIKEWTKQKTFEAAAESTNSWRVVSISEAALQQIANSKSAKGLRRGHILSRSERARRMFGVKEPMSKEQLTKFFFDNDTVALITKEENAKDGPDHWTPLHAVPDGIFNSGSFSIHVRKRKDLPWVLSHKALLRLS